MARVKSSRSSESHGEELRSRQRQCVQRRSAGAQAGRVLSGAAIALVLALATGQSSSAGNVSCVQMVDARFSPTRCDRATFAFTMNGEVSIEGNTVNVVVVVDGSGSILPLEWVQTQEFAKNTIDAFAARDLFVNGGSASYVQFSYSAKTYGPFYSTAAFDTAVDDDLQMSGGTVIADGISAARDVLSDNPASGSFMVVMTDGLYFGTEPVEEASAARAEGVIIFAVGVGDTFLANEQTLLDIAGEEDRVFRVGEFDQLDAALDGIFNTETVISCEATGVEVSVNFTVPVVSAEADGNGASSNVAGSSAVFNVEDLEDNPVRFEAKLDLCELGEIDDTQIIVESFAYVDDQENIPDMTILDALSSDEGDVRPGTHAARVLIILAIIGFVFPALEHLVASPDAARRDGGEHDTVAHDNVTRKRPAASLSHLLMRQLQFLAMLSLVDHIVSMDSWLGDFLIGLRWVHLWVPSPEAGGLKSGEIPVPDECKYVSGVAELDINAFMWNLVLIVGIVTGILIVHLSVVSGVEATWLAKNYAKTELQRHNAWLTQAAEARLRDLSGRRVTLEEMSSTLDPIAECRDLSRSVWLHFPHVELVFLFYAFEGAVTAQLSSLFGSGCPVVYTTATIALGLYPLLMFLSTWRTIAVRIHPGEHVKFAELPPPQDMPADAGLWKAWKISWKAWKTSRKTWRTSWKALRTSWKAASLFSWADKGAWTTVATTDADLNRDGNWFRIGFEPMFADYTQEGAWFVLISLVEFIATAVVVVFLDSSLFQLLGLLVIKVVMLAIILRLAPYANRVVNELCAFDAVVAIMTVSLEAVSAAVWEDTVHEQRVNAAVASMQVMTFIAITIPLYVDSAVIALEAARSRVLKVSSSMTQWRQGGGGEARARRLLLVYVLRTGLRHWCTMIRLNAMACASDVRRGLQRSRFTPAMASRDALRAGQPEAGPAKSDQTDGAPGADEEVESVSDQKLENSIPPNGEHLASGPTALSHVSVQETKAGRGAGHVSQEVVSIAPRATTDPALDREESKEKPHATVTNSPRLAQDSMRSKMSSVSGRSIGSAAKALSEQDI